MKRRTGAQLFQIFQALLIIACLAGVVPSAVVAQEPVKVGVIIPLSGPFAMYGDTVRKGLELERSAQIRYIFEDEGCDPAKAVSAFKKLSVLDQVRIFIGPACGSPQEVVAPLLRGTEALAILNSSASREFYRTSGGRMLSVQYAIEEESEFNAKQIFQVGYKDVAVVLFESQFSRTHEKAFRSAYKGKIHETLAYSDPNGAGLKSIALKIKALAPSALYVPDAAPFLSSFMTELHKIGVSVPVYSVYSFQMPAVIEAEGKHAEGVRYSYPRVGTTDAIAYFPSLAARILGQSISRCGANTSCLMADLMKHNSFDDFGILRSPNGMELRTVRDGKFVVLNSNS